MGYMDDDVVKNRQASLELYMTRIVETMSDVVSSSYIDIFLNMKNRIAVITSKIQQEERIAAANAVASGEIYDETKLVHSLPKVVPVPGGTKELSSATSICSNPVIEKKNKYSLEQQNQIVDIDILVSFNYIVVS